MPDTPDQMSAALDEVREILAGIGLDPSSHGDAADAVRAALAKRGTHLDSVADAARAVSQAVRDRAALLAVRDAQMPTDAEISAAQQAVIAAASAAADGTGSQADVQAAVQRLSDLLAQKQAVQEQFEHGENNLATTLDDATKDLPDAPDLPGLGGGNPLAALLSTLGQLPRPQLPMGGAPMSVNPAADPAATTPAGAVDPAALLDALEPDSGGNSSKWGERQLDDGMTPGEGQTHLSSGSLPATPTLSGVHTAADVSGRPANPFTVATPPGAAGSSTGAGGGGAGAPMAPMAPMSGSRGAASGKSKNGSPIINRDPDFSGADIDVERATSGIIGRDEKHLTGGN